MAVYLIFTMPDGEETKVHLTSSITVGRISTNDVVLPEAGVSSNHAIISLEKDGKILVQDLKSSNGSFKNGHPFKKCFLQVNDILKLHKVKVKIEKAKLSEKELINIGMTKESEVDSDLTLPSLSLNTTTKTKKIS